MGKVLVAFFSATGTTAHVGREIAAILGADAFEIKPEKPYTPADLDWRDRGSRSSMEMNDESCRPAIVGIVDDMASYDAVFIGFPVWWYVEPRIIDTFLESYNFDGKKIVPFATSGGSGLGEAPQRMQQIAKGSIVLPGKLFNGRLEVDGVRRWAESLGL